MDGVLSTHINWTGRLEKNSSKKSQIDESSMNSLTDAKIVSSEQSAEQWCNYCVKEETICRYIFQWIYRVEVVVCAANG